MCGVWREFKRTVGSEKKNVKMEFKDQTDDRDLK